MKAYEAHGTLYISYDVLVAVAWQCPVVNREERVAGFDNGCTFNTDMATFLQRAGVQAKWCCPATA